jgi:exosortase/archaeosortase family protein
LIPLRGSLTARLEGAFQNGTYSFLSPFFKTNSYTIDMGNFVMPIDELASGLHICIPVTIFSLGWALYKRYSLYNVIVMLIVSLLLSLFVNVFRVMMVCWIGNMNPDLGGFLSHTTPLLLAIPVIWVIILLSRLIHQRQEFRKSMRTSATG